MSKRIKKWWCMDYETMINLYIGVFIDAATDTTHVFVIHYTRNDIKSLIEFLNQNIEYQEWHVSFNGLAFDSQISQYIIKNQKSLLKKNANEIVTILYEYAQRTIEKSNKREFADYPEWKLSIKQLDLFKMNHWDNKAKSSSLKWLEYAMDWYNVEEMPIHHTVEVHKQEDLDLIVSYCINDVRSTKEILKASREQVQLRMSLTKEFDINLMSASEPRISKEIFADILSKKLNIDKIELKKLRTPRTYIKGEELMLPYISFKTETFKRVESWFKQLVVDYVTQMSNEDRKKKYKFSVNYRGNKIDYGLGGIHGINPGIHESKEGFVIISSDVSSFYPNLAIRNQWSPAHLDKEIFTTQYEWFYNERKKIPKSNPKNYAWKICLNSSYGLSSDENSFLYDPMFTMLITINGQLLLTMLLESLCEQIPNAKPIMQNTDGLEIMIPIEFKDKYFEICKEWEQLTKLELEHDDFSKLISPDINNFIGIHSNGTTKAKGRFEWEDLDKKKISVLHKNKSFLIIPKAIYNYFVNNIRPEDFLKENRNIFDYCAGVKIKGAWHFEERSIQAGNLVVKPLHKMVRYYMSNTHKDVRKLMKIHNEDGREFQVQASSIKQVVCNFMDKSKPFEEYEVEDKFYLDAIYKEIKNIDKELKQGNVQLQLF